MSFDNASITWSVNQLSSMVKNGRIVFKNVVQRGLVWEKTRKSKLIESSMINFPIPDVYARRFDDGSGKRNSNVYDMMDGKQRLTTFSQFLNNEFALTDLSPVTFYNDLTDEEETIDVSGMTFQDLPDGLREKIKNARISVIYFDNLTKEEERELFKRLNAGKPLSTKSRVLASCKHIEGLLDIGSHKIFEDMLTEKSIENKNQVTLVMKTWCMLNQNVSDVSFESKIFNPLIEQTEISEKEENEIVKVFDFAYEIHSILIERKEKSVARKFYKETHFISLVPYINMAIKDNIDLNMFADWIVDFYGCKNTSVSAKYNLASSNGAAKNSNIVLRDRELELSYNDFFKEDEAELDHDDLSDSSNSYNNFKNITDDIVNDMEGVV